MGLKCSSKNWVLKCIDLKCWASNVASSKNIHKSLSSNSEPQMFSLICLAFKKRKKPYTIGTRNDVLSQKYIRNQFLPTESIFLPLSDVPQRQTTLRSSATFESNSTGQGFVHCQCTNRCKTKKYKCRQLFRSCNSRWVGIFLRKKTFFSRKRIFFCAQGLSLSLSLRPKHKA